MSAVRRVYRATAWYAFRYGGEYAVTRHFLTKRSRDNWAQQRREGYPERPGTSREDEGMAAIPPALRVETADSEPVVFP